MRVLRISIVLLVLFQSMTFGQNVKVSSGKMCISDNESFDIAYNRVVNDLKADALRKAGVEERIMEFSTLSISERGEQISEVFYSNFLSTINGTIKNLQVTEIVQGYDEALECYYFEVDAKVKVKKYKTKTDPKFKCEVNGLKSNYANEETIEFSVKPFMDSYVTIFYIGEDEASRIFPFENQDNLIHKDTDKKFNQFGAYTEHNFETGRILIVITKEKIPYICTIKDEQGYLVNTSVDEIFNWLLLIEPDQRSQSYHEVGILTK